MNTPSIKATKVPNLQDHADQVGEVALDIGLEETFPASDPVAITITQIKGVVVVKQGSEML